MVRVMPRDAAPGDFLQLGVRLELIELVIDAWTMVVPKRVVAEYLGEAG